VTALVLAIRRESGLWLVAAGVLLGLAMQANPVLVLMLPGVAVWSFIQRKSAIGLRTRWPYLTAAASILAYAPVIVYNVQTGLAGIREVIAVRPYAWQLHLSPLAFIQNLQCLGLQLCRQVGGVLEGSENLATLMGLPILSGAWAIAGLLYATRRRLSLLPLAVASHVLIMPWLSGNYGMIWETRYTNHLTPLVFVAMSALAARVWSRVSASVRGPRIARAAKWPVGVLLVALGLWPLTSIFQYYERETAAGRTNTHCFAFWDEFTERWQGERVFLSESVNGFILAGDLNASEYFGFNATCYFLATNNMPYDFMPIDQIMRTLAAGRETGRVILILTNGELPRVELQTELVAWNSPDVMEACYRLGYGAYVIEEAQ
jgi:hypothetical protein